MKEEAPKHCPPGCPLPPHTPSSLGHTHTGGMATGGPVEPASPRGEAASSDPYSPRGTPIQHLALDLVKALRPGQAHPVVTVSLTHGSSDNAGRGKNREEEEGGQAK